VGNIRKHGTAVSCREKEKSRYSGELKWYYWATAVDLRYEWRRYRQVVVTDLRTSVCRTTWLSWLQSPWTVGRDVTTCAVEQAPRSVAELRECPGNSSSSLTLHQQTRSCLHVKSRIRFFMVKPSQNYGVSPKYGVTILLALAICEHTPP